MHRLAVCLALLVALALVGHAQPYKPDSRTLLLDHLDETFVPDGKLMTRPEVGKPVGGMTGGRPMAGEAFVPGRFGNALEFHGLTKMDYPAGSNINLAAGLLEFWISLNFDAAEQMKNPGVLSNQLFWPSGARRAARSRSTRASNRLCAGVWDTNRQLIAYTAIPGTWKKDEWHHVALGWGRQLVLSWTISSPTRWSGSASSAPWMPGPRTSACSSAATSA